MFICKKNCDCCNYSKASYKDELKYTDVDRTDSPYNTCSDILEVEPVIHAVWTRTSEDLQFIRCSHCSFFMSTIQPRNGSLDAASLRYCPCCGAKMTLISNVNIKQKCDNELLDFVRDTFANDFRDGSMAIVDFGGEHEGKNPRYLILQKDKYNDLGYGQIDTYEFSDTNKEKYRVLVDRLTQLAQNNGAPEWSPCVGPQITLYTPSQFTQIVQEAGI